MNNTTLYKFSQIFKKDYDDRNSILDPFTCIVRLAVLGFKPEGTKISVFYNRISYNEPGILQGIMRWTYGDNREDLHNLFNPIKKVIEWYNLTIPEIKGICEFAIKGLNVLMKSYKTQSIICHSLEHYATILQKALDNTNKNVTSEDLTLSKNFIKEKSKLKMLNSINDSKYSLIYSNLRELWNKREITIVYNILLEISNLEEEDYKKNPLIDSINSILSMKEYKTRRYIIENTTILE